MAKVVTELIYSRSFEKKSAEPIALISDIKDFAASYGEMRMLSDNIMNSSSGVNATAKFEITKSMDGITCFLLILEMRAESDYVCISISGSTLARLESQESTFGEFYMREIYPEMLSKARHNLERACHALESKINSL